ncbi:MAG: hypothetical protein JWM31_1512 [Solirubrobacterales bacterium]|nr:hypothetical protein [Solirubrobacterales bacterium]
MAGSANSKGALAAALADVMHVLAQGFPNVPLTGTIPLVGSRSVEPLQP